MGTYAYMEAQSSTPRHMFSAFNLLRQNSFANSTLMLSLCVINKYIVYSFSVFLISTYLCLHDAVTLYSQLVVMAEESDEDKHLVSVSFKEEEFEFSLEDAKDDSTLKVS